MNAFWLEFGRYFSSFACLSLIFYIMTDCLFPRWVNRWAWMLLCVFSTLISIGLTLSGLIYIAWLYIGISAATMAAYMACYAYLLRGHGRKSCFCFRFMRRCIICCSKCPLLQRRFFPGHPFWASFTLRAAFFCFVILLMQRLWRQVIEELEANTGRNWYILAFLRLVINIIVYAATLTWVVLLRYDPAPWLAVLFTEMALVVVEYTALMQIVILLGQQQTAQAAEAQRKLLEKQMEAEKTYVDQTRAHRHDMQHYMTAVGGYI